MTDDNQPPVAWHLSREVTVSTLIAVAITFTTGMTAYSDIKSDVKEVQKYVAESAVDRIRKETVIQMFATKEIQIKAVKDDVQKLREQSIKIEAKIDRSQELLLEIIRTMPKRPQ